MIPYVDMNLSTLIINNFFRRSCMIIKSFTSDILNREFDKRFEKLNNVRSFSRFRSFVAGYGLSYNSFNKRNYQLVIAVNDNVFTKFGEILMGINAKYPIDSSKTEKWLTEDGDFNVASLRFDFIGHVKDENSELIQSFLNLLLVADKQFAEREHAVETQKKLYGISANDTLESFGATHVEKQSYWKNIIDKRIITPIKYMGFLNFIDSKCKDNILTEDDILFLPKEGTLAKQIIDAYLEARPTCQII